MPPVPLSYAVGYLFETTSARRVFADIDPDNIASIRVFGKLGFTRGGLLRGTWNTHIGIRDSVIFGLMKTDPMPDIGPAPRRDDMNSVRQHGREGINPARSAHPKE